ncbi:hypothetical protein HZU83_05620 [Sphaerotilus montanus]|jgi:hypothetical protein|uniref:Uncharacterized protein n=1 Tax=Sphaerotilus montanus TaxID=522889 RepID=A0A7Y9QYG8_9BURK|nr:hypothetical protein [Sphaerotilus montanus]NYG32319.1 hypothetical protein [Sphaerotilus montanus]NZD56151.1 hypothetical protein [Sphaerotilus montanus]
MATRRTSRTARADSAFELAAKVAGLPTQPGLGAIKAEYRAGVALRSGHRHTASLDIDTAFLATEPTSSRWDYGIGMRSEAGQELLVWLEAHPASSTGEVQKMLDKLAWLKAKLARPDFDGLRTLEHKVSAYRWLAMTGAIRILPNSREARRLAQAGLSSPQRHVELP